MVAKSERAPYIRPVAREGRMSEPTANVDMANAWDGEEGDQWTQFADEFDTHFRSIWARFLETDPIAPTDRVLDIGCGSGLSTRDAARLARDGSALGVDLSESMLAEGRRRASTRNEWIMVVRESMAAGRDLPMPPPGAPGPAALADPDDVEALLTGVGF